VSGRIVKPSVVRSINTTADLKKAIRKLTTRQVRHEIVQTEVDRLAKKIAVVTEIAAEKSEHFTHALKRVALDTVEHSEPVAMVVKMLAKQVRVVYRVLEDLEMAITADRKQHKKKQAHW